MERESDGLEYKDKVTDSFLKTVSAFANFKTGKIVFGISDALEVKGLADLKKSALAIENKINDALDPVPDYRISLDEEQRTITLEVRKGSFAPYLYQGQAYMRRDSSSIPVDRSMLLKLLLDDKNLSFDQLPSGRTDLTFPTLEKMLQTKIGLKNLGKDTLITLDLYSPGFGYTKAGLLFSSENTFPGIEVIRFGKSNDEILTRKSFTHQSVLDLYDNVCDLFGLFYSFEKIDGMERRKFFRIPETAFREALANALVHRDWSISSASVQIAMYEDRIEIISPGGLPDGMTEELYLQEYYSIVRNPQVAYVFLRLGLIEKFGTGIARIMEAYKNEIIKPAFHITPNTIKVTLPLTGQFGTLDEDQQLIYRYLKENPYASRSEVEKYCGFSRSKTTNLLNRMMADHIIGRTGNSRSIQYFIL